MTTTFEIGHDERPPEPMLSAAHSHAGKGVPICPCSPRTKQPLTRHGFKDATTDRAIIESWWSEYPDAMIGMPTGRITGVFVVDLDTKHDGPKHFAALCEQHGGAAVTRTATTPTLGSHLHYRYPEDRHIRNSASKLGRGIDIRGEGGCIILPPSRRYDGAAYRWNNSEGEASVADAPEWLLDLIDPPASFPKLPVSDRAAGSNWAQAALQSELGRVLSASEGERNEFLNLASFALGQIVAGGALASEFVVERLLAAALAIGLKRDEAEATIASGMIAGAGQPRSGPGPSASRPGRRDSRLSEPLPLFPPLPSEELYPLESLGPLLSKAARAIARTVQVPDAIAGQSVLAVASLAAQALADVRMPFGQRRPLSLDCLTIAGSGDRKSTADNEALKPVRRREQKLREVYEGEEREWRITHAAWAAQKRKIEMTGKQDLDARKLLLQALGPEPDRPLLPILIAPDPTIEGLARMWVNAPAALGIFSAEGGQFFGGPGMSPENKLKTASALSSLWDGSGHRRVRASDGLTDLVDRRLASHLMVQPDPAAAGLADPILKSQGLLSRFLVAAPASLSGTRLCRDPEASDVAAIEAYAAHLHEILSMPWPLAEGKRNELQPRELVLPPRAAAALKAFSDHIECQCGSEGELAPIRDFAAKAAEHAARIAGVLTIVEDPKAREISVDAIACGITLTEWYVIEALRLHASARTDPKLITAQRLLDWMRRQVEPVLALRDILRCGPADLRKKAAAQSALGTLTDHGLIVEVSTSPLAYRVVEGLPS